MDLLVRANGVDIAYERVGDGPPLVFVHGAADDGRVWQPQLAALADEFTVIAWDEPGAGRSSDVPAHFGLADHADCLAALIEALALGPAHVAGLSWGGTVVQELYRHHPELVASLILTDTYAGWKGSLPAAEVPARVAGARQVLAAPSEEFDPTVPGLFASGPPAEFVPLIEEIGRPARPAAPYRRADPAHLGRARRALAAERRTPARPGNPGQQPRAARAVNEAVPQFCRAHSPR